MIPYVSQSSLHQDFPISKKRHHNSSCSRQNPWVLLSHVTYNWQLFKLTTVVTDIMYIPSHHVHHQYLLQDTIISYLDCCNSILIVHPISTLVYRLSNLHMAPRVIFFKIINLTRFLNDFPLYSEKISIPYHGLWVLEYLGVCLWTHFLLVSPSLYFGHDDLLPIPQTWQDCLCVRPLDLLCSEPGIFSSVRKSVGFPWLDFSFHSELCSDISSLEMTSLDHSS